MFNRRVEWGMETDSQSTTHPISVHVKNTEMAKSIFDGISYGFFFTFYLIILLLLLYSKRCCSFKAIAVFNWKR